MVKRSKAYQEGLDRLSADLAAAKANTDKMRVTKRELAEAKSEVAENTDWLVNVPKELSSAGMETQGAPTTNQERPRAWTIAYNPTMRKLIVVFRDNTWWEYNDVSPELWMGLKQSGSTGKFLRASGLDNWHDMGPANLDGMSSGAKERISQSAQIGSRMKTRIPLPDDFNIRNVTAKELFNEIL
jgi:hypothetical protein